MIIPAGSWKEWLVTRLKLLTTETPWELPQIVWARVYLLNTLTSIDLVTHQGNNKRVKTFLLWGLPTTQQVLNQSKKSSIRDQDPDQLPLRREALTPTETTDYLPSQTEKQRLIFNDPHTNSHGFLMNEKEKRSTRLFRHEKISDSNPSELISNQDHKNFYGVAERIRNFRHQITCSLPETDSFQYNAVPTSETYQLCSNDSAVWHKSQHSP